MLMAVVVLATPPLKNHTAIFLAGMWPGPGAALAAALLLLLMPENHLQVQARTVCRARDHRNTTTGLLPNPASPAGLTCTEHALMRP